MGVYTIFDKYSGKLIKVYGGRFIDRQCCVDQDYIEGDYDDTKQYYDLEKKIIRNKSEVPIEIDKKQIQADGIDSLKIEFPKTEPNGTSIKANVSINKKQAYKKIQTYEITDSLFEFSTDTPGTYQITCESMNYLPRVIEVTAYD